MRDLKVESAEGAVAENFKVRADHMAAEIHTGTSDVGKTTSLKIATDIDVQIAGSGQTPE